MFVKNGQPVAGSAWIAYSLDGSGNQSTMVRGQPFDASPGQLALMGVTTQADPPPPPAVMCAWNTFVGRFTDTEWAGVQRAINNQVAAGNGALARFITLSAVNGIDMSAAQTATYKAQLVTAAILTQARADAIFVAP